MEINEGKYEIKEVNKDNKEEEENKEGREIKKEGNENIKEEGEIKKKEENNNTEGGNKKEEDKNKIGGEIKKVEENNNTERDEIEKEEDNNNAKGGEIKKEEENNNKEEGEIKKEEENNKEGGEIKKEGNENNKEDSEIKKVEENCNIEGGGIKKEEEENNKDEDKIKKEGNENNKDACEIKKEDKKSNNEEDEIKKEVNENNIEGGEIKKEGKENKEEGEIKKEGKENKEEDGENKSNNENNKEDEENEKKKDWCIIKVIGENIDTEKLSQFENEHSKFDQIIMENACISDYINKSPNFENLKSFKVKNAKQFPNDKFLKKMTKLNELSIKSIPNLQIDFLEFLPQYLQELYLEKNNFINMDFRNIFNFYISKKDIAKNLKCLSFAGNNLTRIDLSSPKLKFERLIELDFRKNKICKIFINSESFPKLKFVNCCKNCLNRSYLNNLKNVISLESVNGYLLEPEFCEPYYKKLKETLMNKDKVLFNMKYLNISHMPRVQSLEYFISFKMVENVTKNLKKLDLSYNKLNNDTFFKFINENQKFKNLRTLNLNANDIDDKFFEEKKFQDVFCSLEHLYLNSNKIGDMDISIKYDDGIPIDAKYHNDNDKKLIYKLRAIYNFIERNKNLTKLTITKNPISEFYSVVPESKNDADKSEKYIKRDINGMIMINCLFSLCIKIRDELLTQKDARETFNLRFDCRSNVNKNSSNYPYSDKPFIYKSK